MSVSSNALSEDALSRTEPSPPSKVPKWRRIIAWRDERDTPEPR
jgi:hypothetical protein